MTDILQQRDPVSDPSTGRPSPGPGHAVPSGRAPSGISELEQVTEVCIGDVQWRQRVRVRGRIRALRVQPWEGGVATLECTLVDDTGGLMVIFMGRRKLGGVKIGARMEVEGMVIESRSQLAVMNPAYTLLPDGS